MLHVWFRVSARETHVSTLLTWFLSCVILFGFQLQNRFSLLKVILTEARNQSFSVEPKSILPFVVVEICEICFIPSLPFLVCWCLLWTPFTTFLLCPDPLNLVYTLLYCCLSYPVQLPRFNSIRSLSRLGMKEDLGLKDINPFIFSQHILLTPS